MITIIIASYNEPKATLRAVNTFLKQIDRSSKVIVVDPFEEVGKYLKKQIKDKRFLFYLDPGEGKSYALNLLFQEFGTANKEDLFILSDGDVYVSEKAVSEIKRAFKDKTIGCVTGRPVPVEDRSTKYGYWQHLLFDGIGRVRARLSKNKRFFECSGYLFAIRQGVITDFPLETSEDSIIPYLFWKKGYKISYVARAEVYVKNPNNWKDYYNQKIRNIKAHEALNKIAPDMPRTKSFFNELKGSFFALYYPRNLREIGWTIQLFLARLYIYLKAFSESNRSYRDGWRETEISSTKPLD